MTDPYGEVQDPSTSAQRLAELAAAHPELGPWISAHPNAYPELQQWIATYAQPAPASPAPTAEQNPPAGASQPFAPAAPADPFAATSPFASSAPAPYGAPAPAGADAAPRPRRRRKGLLIGLSIGVAAALVLAGGGVWWFVASRLGGASSPEAAFTKLVSGVQGMDPLTLYGSFAPSEVGLLKDPIQKLANAKPKDAEKGVDVAKLIDEIKSNVTITSKDLAFSTDELADRVARVTWTGGEVTIDGDAGKVADAVVRAYEPALRAQYQESGYSSSEIDERVADQKRSVADGIDLPYTLSPASVSKDGNAPWALVMVDEGSGWYVSPMLSYADAVYRTARQDRGVDVGSLGRTVVPAANYATPEDAASGLTKAAMSGDLDQVAGSLPLPERRLLSIYGPSLPKAARDWYRTSVKDVSLTEARFSSTVDGDRARLSVDKLALSVSRYSSSVSTDLTTTWSLTKRCVDWSSEYAYDDGYYSSGRYSWQSGQWISNWKVKTSDGSGCLDDIPALKKLGADQVAIIAVKENGGWLVSPTATVGDAAGIATDNFLGYYENGTLDELFR